MPNHVMTSRVVLTYSQLERETISLRAEVAFYEQEVESLREQVQFYRTELENLLEKLEGNRDEQ